MSRSLQQSESAGYYLAPVATEAALATAYSETELYDSAGVYVKAEKADYHYQADAVSGDVSPSDQTGGTGFWIKDENGTGGGGGSTNYLGTYTSLANLQAAYPNADPGNYADVDAGAASDVQRYIWDETDTSWVLGAGGGGVVDGDKGDITVSGSGATWDINNNSVTTSKIPAGAVVNANLADINQNIIKGRQAGAGVGPPQNLTATDVRDIINVEDGADVTDTTNVTAAGALMDSEVTNLAQVKAFNSADYATAAQGATADAALPGGTKLDDLSAPDDNTDLNVSITAHGLAPKLPNDATQFLNGVGNYSTPLVGASDSVVMEVYNDSGVLISKGMAVYIVDWNIPNAVPTVALARSDSSTTMPALGLVQADIADASLGNIMVVGSVVGEDTTGYTLDDALYIDPTTAGNLTTTKPVGSNYIQVVARVTRVHGTQGTLFVAGALRSNDIPNFTAADKFWYGGIDGVSSEGDITAAGRALLDDANAAAQLVTLGAATSAQGALADSAQQPPTEGAFVNGDKTKLDSLVTNATHTGDVTGSTALTIANNVVTNAKLAQMATKTIKGNNTGGVADPLDLTVTQLLTLLLNKTDLPQETNPNRADDPMLIYDVSAALFKYILPVDITAKMPTNEITDPDLTTGNYDITIDDRGHHLLVNCSTLCTIRVDLFANVAIPNNTQIFVTDLTGNGVQFGKVNTPITFTYNSTLYSLETAGQLTPPIMMTWYDTDEILFQGGLAAA